MIAAFDIGPPFWRTVGTPGPEDVNALINGKPQESGRRAPTPPSAQPALVGHGPRPLLADRPVRQHHLGRRPRGRRDGQMEAVATVVDMPRRLDPPVGRVVHRLGPREPAAGP